jgi:hypothetical protein
MFCDSIIRYSRGINCYVQGTGSDIGGSTYKEVRRYNHNQVIAMTDNWKVELGKGGFGTVYLGELPQDDKLSNTLQPPQKVALKKLSRTSQQGNVEFLNEVINQQWPGRFWGINIGQNPGLSKSTRVHLAIYHYIR